MNPVYLLLEGRTQAQGEDNFSVQFIFPSKKVALGELEEWYQFEPHYLIDQYGNKYKFIDRDIVYQSSSEYLKVKFFELMMEFISRFQKPIA